MGFMHVKREGYICTYKCIYMYKGRGNMDTCRYVKCGLH